jgi:hypothetical protein
LCICILAFSRSSFATEQFQRKPHIFSDLHCPLSHLLKQVVHRRWTNGAGMNLATRHQKKQSRM